MILAIYYLKILTMTQKMIASETEIGKKKTKNRSPSVISKHIHQ